jgi:hypothetical protein
LPQIADSGRDPNQGRACVVFVQQFPDSKAGIAKTDIGMRVRVKIRLGIVLLRKVQLFGYKEIKGKEILVSWLPGIQNVVDFRLKVIPVVPFKYAAHAAEPILFFIRLPGDCLSKNNDFYALMEEENSRSSARPLWAGGGSFHQ